MGHSHSHSTPTQIGQFIVSPRLKTLCGVLMFLGVLVFAITLIKDTPRAWYAYLIGFFYTSTLAVGGLFLVALQYLTSAGWSVNVRRLFESFTAFLPVAFVLGIILFVFGGPHIYVWFDSAKVAASHLLQHKAPYLNKTFFFIRFFAFFIAWIFFKKAIVGRSLEQDKTGNDSLTSQIVPYSVAFILVFAITYSFFSIDALMSLEPTWFSTIFGVYLFAGLFQSTIALTILMVAYLSGKGLLKGFIDANHLHDLGKFLFGFTVFWAYIAFSQYMLIWYANLPEETVFFLPRVSGSWVYVSIALLLFKFIVPFLALLPQWVKRSLNHLSVISVLILVMQFVDLYWLVYPNYNAESVRFGISEIFIFLGFFGAFLFVITSFLSKHNLVPLKDPRIHESLHHHVVY